MNVLTSLTSLKNFTLLRGREQSSASYVKQSLKNLAEVTEKLFHAASSLQNQFESNGKRYTENESNSPSFLNEVNVRKESMENLLETIKSLQDEIQKLPELIEISKRKFQEEMTRFYEDHLEKALSSTIETCLAISKEKIDDLTSFVIEDLSGL
ncbi:hypothetical protein ECG_08790 [Echinococcus granulosus]|nr:hypothetical protein ECG_08790 [Echinococcus granulosus]